MPVTDYIDFMLYEKMEPFGGRRGDIHAGIIASVIANVNRGKDAPEFKPKDFILNWDVTETKPQTVEEQLHLMKLVQAAQNGK